MPGDVEPAAGERGVRAAPPEPVAHDYDRIWDTVYGDLQEIGPVHRHMRRILRGVLRGLHYTSVLDVGCGAGHNLPLLLEGRDLSRITGVDVSPRALDRARRRFDADFRELDIEAGGLGETFELVFSSLLLEHVADDGAAIANMCAMAERHLVLTTIAGDFERYRPWEERVGHVRNYRRGELERKLARVDFEPRIAIYWGFPLYTPIARRLHNRMEPTSELSRLQRGLAALMYAAYFLNSHRRGDLLIVHAVRSAS